MGWAGVALAVTGGVMQGIGQIQAGREAKQAHEYNAAVSRANAQAVRTANEFDIMRMKKAKRGLVSLQQAGYAKAGVKFEGSPIEVMIDSAAEAELDMAISKYNARVQVSQLGQEAEQAIKAGKAAQRRGLMQGASTLLSTAGSFYTPRTADPRGSAGGYQAYLRSQR